MKAVEEPMHGVDILAWCDDCHWSMAEEKASHYSAAKAAARRHVIETGHVVYVDTERQTRIRRGP